MSDFPYVPARIQTHHAASRPIRLIVIHSTESPQTAEAARGVAHYFQSAAAGGSAHYVVDDREVVCCVRDNDVAAGAPNANHDGLHVEHVGRAAFTAAQWAAPYSQAMLRLSAQLVAAKCREHGVPVVRLTAAQVAAGEHGICGHVDVTNAYHRRGGHTDPGPNWPWEEYLAMVKEHTQPPTPNTPKPIRLVVDGRDVTQASGLQVEAGHATVSVRDLAGAMSWSLEWDDAQQMISVRTK